MKICSECQAEFEPTNNRQLACFVCKVIRQVRLKRERRQSDPEVQKRCRAAVQKYRDENRELVRQRDREKYWASPDIARARVNKYNKSHRDQLTAYNRQWRTDNREHCRVYERMRYHTDKIVNAKKKARAKMKRFGDINPQDIFTRDGYVCYYCGTTSGKFHIDHMIPLSRGGVNTMDNLTVACQTCNLRKHTLTAEEFVSC